MLRPIDTWFLSHETTVAACLQQVRQWLLTHPAGITETWNYSMPFYRINNERLVYLWFHKQLRQPYIGFVDGNQLDHPDLLAEKRSRMKILLLNPAADLPMETIAHLLQQAAALRNIRIDSSRK
jgi:hypothetical protein